MCLEKLKTMVIFWEHFVLKPRTLSTTFEHLKLCLTTWKVVKLGVHEINHLHSRLTLHRTHMEDTSLEEAMINGSHDNLRRGIIRNTTKLLGRTGMYATSMSSMMCCVSDSRSSNTKFQSFISFPTKHASKFQASINFNARINQTCIQTNIHDSIHAMKTKECIKSCCHLRNTNTTWYWVH